MSDNLRGALLMIAAMASFTISDAFLKSLSGKVPLFQLLFMRGMAMVVLITLIAWWMGVLRYRLPRRDWRFMLMRMVGEIGGAYFFLTAVFNMPLANASAIMQSLPLVVTLAAALFLRVPIGWRRMIAIFIGFVGVMIIVRPGPEGFSTYSLYAVVAVLFVTLRDLSTNRFARDIPSLMITLLTAVAVTVFFGIANLNAPWIVLEGGDWVNFTGATLMVTMGYLLSVMVMRVGDIAFVSPFRYTGLLWALILGWLVFGDWPTLLTLVGATVVVGSGIFTLYRESRVLSRGPAQTSSAPPSHPS